MTIQVNLALTCGPKCNADLVAQLHRALLTTLALFRKEHRLKAISFSGHLLVS